MSSSVLKTDEPMNRCYFSDWASQQPQRSPNPGVANTDPLDIGSPTAIDSEVASAPKSPGPDTASPAQKVVSIPYCQITPTHLLIPHQYTEDCTEEEDYTVDRELVSVALRVKLGDFLKTLATDVDDHGIVKEISSDGKVNLMTDNGVCVFEHDDTYVLTYTTGHDDCTFIGPNRDTTWLYFQQSSICGQVCGPQDAWNLYWSVIEGQRRICA